jgi:hypothetical protein
MTCSFLGAFVLLVVGAFELTISLLGAFVFLGDFVLLGAFELLSALMMCSLEELLNPRILRRP